MRINQGHARCIATGLKYIYEKENFDPKVLSEHLKGAVCPEIEEIMEAFEQNKLWLKSEGMA